MSRPLLLDLFAGACGWHADRETDYPAHLTQVLSPWVRADGGDQ